MTSYQRDTQHVYNFTEYAASGICRPAIFGPHGGNAASASALRAAERRNSPGAIVDGCLQHEPPVPAKRLRMQMVTEILSRTL